jgi:hypothetical protein
MRCTVDVSAKPQNIDVINQFVCRRCSSNGGTSLQEICFDLLDVIHRGSTRRRGDMSRKDVWVSSSQALRDAILTLPREVRESAASPMPYYVHLERADPWSDAAKRGVGFVFTIPLEELIAYQGPILQIQFDDEGADGNATTPSKRKTKPTLLVILPDSCSGALWLPFRLHCIDININFVWEAASGASPSLLARTLHIGAQPLSSAKRLAFPDNKQHAGLSLRGALVSAPCEFLCVEQGSYLEVVDSDVSLYRPPVSQSANTVGCQPGSGIFVTSQTSPPPTFQCTNSAVHLQLTDPDSLPGATLREREEGANLELCYFRTLVALITVDSADMVTDDSSTVRVRRRDDQHSRIVIADKSVISCSGLCPWTIVCQGAQSLVEVTAESRLLCGTLGALAIRHRGTATLHQSHVSEGRAFPGLYAPRTVEGLRQATADRTADELAHLNNLRIELLPLWYQHLLKTVMQPSRNSAIDGAASPYCAVECRGAGSSVVIEGSSTIFSELTTSTNPTVQQDHYHGRVSIAVVDGARAVCVDCTLSSMSACARVTGSGSLLTTKQCRMSLVTDFDIPLHDPLMIHHRMQHDEIRSAATLVEVAGDLSATASPSTWNSDADTLTSSWVAPVAVRVSDCAVIHWRGTVLLNCHRVGVRIERNCAATLSNVEIHAATPRCVVPTDDGGELAYVMGGRYPTTIAVESLSSGDLVLTDVNATDFEIGFLIATKPTDSVHAAAGGAVPAALRQLHNCCVNYKAASTAPVCCFAFVGSDAGPAYLRGGCVTPPQSAATSDVVGTFVRIECGAVVEMEHASPLPDQRGKGPLLPSEWTNRVTFGQVASVGGRGSVLRLHGGRGGRNHIASYVVAEVQQQRACGGLFVYDGACAEVTDIAIIARYSLQPASEDGSCGVMLMDPCSVQLANVHVQGFEIGFSTSTMPTLMCGDGNKDCGGDEVGARGDEPERVNEVTLIECGATKCHTSFLWGSPSGSVSLVNCTSSEEALVGCASAGLAALSVSRSHAADMSEPIASPYVTEHDFLRM